MSKGKRKPPTPAVAYPPGWFTEPCRAWKQLQYQGAVALAGAGEPAGNFGELAQRGRRAAAKKGNGWGCGTLPMPGTPRHSAPAWMVRRPKA